MQRRFALQGMGRAMEQIKMAVGFLYPARAREVKSVCRSNTYIEYFQLVYQYGELRISRREEFSADQCFDQTNRAATSSVGGVQRLWR